MRENRSVDLILGIVGVGSCADRDALFYPNSANSANRPEISFVYVPGSDALPSEPVPQAPLNGSWSVESGIDPARYFSTVVLSMIQQSYDWRMVYRDGYFLKLRFC